MNVNSLFTLAAILGLVWQSLLWRAWVRWWRTDRTGNPCAMGDRAKSNFVCSRPSCVPHNIAVILECDQLSLFSACLQWIELPSFWCPLILWVAI
jgi:hypothetical protein